ncbi:MAG: hypothetical protein ACI4JM_11795 [Oscillospiraceae bacterium]
MKIKDIYMEYAKNLQPNEEFKNTLKTKLDEAEKNCPENKNENLYETNFKVMETKKVKLSFIIPLIAAIGILCTLTLVAATFFRDKSDEKKYFITTLAEETDLSDDENVSEIYMTDVSHIETDIAYDENMQKKTDIYAADMPEVSHIETDIAYDENNISTAETTFSSENEITSDTTSDNGDSDYIQLNFDKIYASAGGSAVAEIYIDKSYSLYILLLQINFDKYYISLESQPEFCDDDGKYMFSTSNMHSNSQPDYFLIEMLNPRSSGLKIRAVFNIDYDTPPGNYEVSFDIHNATGISAYDENFINVKGFIEVS